MNILVTGGAGYIGSHTILEIFEKKDWNVFSIDNYCNSDPLSYKRIKSVSGQSVNYSDVDLKDLKALDLFFSKNEIQGIIHFAALKSVPESVEKPLDYFDNNINGLLNLIQCCQKYKIDKFIFSSSCSVYGNTEELPVSESTPLNKAQSPYALTKQMGEQIIDACSDKNNNISFISLRYFNPVGAHRSGLIGELPLQTPNNLVPFITQTAAGIREQLVIFGDDYPTRDGTCIRDYVHVSDIANAHLLALERLIEKKNKGIHEIFNLGTGNGVSVLELVKAFEESNKLKLNYKIGQARAGDVAKIFADNGLAQRDLNWSPEFSLEEMMQSAWKWQKELSMNT